MMNKIDHGTAGTTTRAKSILILEQFHWQGWPQVLNHCWTKIFSASLDNTLCPKKVSPLNILQQPPQTYTDLNEILHTQDDIYFCHRRQIS